MPILFGKSKVFSEIIRAQKPVAQAQLKGSEKYSTVHGKVWFYAAKQGTLVVSEVFGLPRQEDCSPNFFALHIHEGSHCTGNAQDPFANTGVHWNPKNCPHPAHAGDLPPLLNNQGYAWLACYTQRFYPKDVIGKTVIIHSKPDDFTTQPSGNSGEKIACGAIRSAK